VVGPVSTSGDNVVVATKATGPVEAPKASVTVLRDPAEQAAYEKSLHPGWAEGWAGGANLGFAVTRGNSETKNLNIAFQAARTGLHDKLSLYSNSIYATNDLPTATPHTTANSIGGGGRYDHDFDGHRLFGFVNANFFHDSLQSLDLRSVFGGGLGWHAIKGDATTLDFLSGINYTHEHYSAFTIPGPPLSSVPAVTHNVAGATLGDEFMHKIGKSTVLTQNLYFYPNLSDGGEYRGTAHVGLVTKINKWLGWQNSVGDIYVSNPPLGKKQNDLLLSTGLNFSFTH
jgi:putative salt-induced outer membrane protein YdiY